MNNKLEEARKFATSAHSNQKYGDFDYSKHLADVEAVLICFGFTNLEIRIAAWLHDVLEDTSVSFTAIENKFGKTVADLVVAVTNEAGKNRKERALKTYPKIRANNDAIVLKLADRIANVEASLYKIPNTSLYKMYHKEYRQFKEALFKTDNATDAMWHYLDTLLDANDETC